MVALLWPVALLNYLDRQMLASMKFSMMAAIPSIGTEAHWGILLGYFKWVYALLSPIGGYAADRFSKKLTICVSLFVWSAVTWWTGHVSSYHELLLARSLMGVSEAFYMLLRALLLLPITTSAAPGHGQIGAHQIAIYCGVIGGGFGGYVADAPHLALAICVRRCRSTRDAVRRASCFPAAVGSEYENRRQQFENLPCSGCQIGVFELLVHTVGSLLHAAGPCSMGRARLDAGHPETAVSYRAGQSRS